MKVHFGWKLGAGGPEFPSKVPAPRRSAPEEYRHKDIKTTDSGRHILRLTTAFFFQAGFFVQGVFLFVETVLFEAGEGSDFCVEARFCLERVFV